MTQDDRYRVMTADESAVIRGLSSRTLEADPSIPVGASVSNGKLARDTLPRHDVEIIALDIEMPAMDGPTAPPLRLEAKPGVRVLMVSTLTRNNAAVSRRALSMGAADDVTKPSATAEVPSACPMRRRRTSADPRSARCGAAWPPRRPGPACVRRLRRDLKSRPASASAVRPAA
ncbi:MAG: response regulator [Kiloniellaceae bacterium]